MSRSTALAGVLLLSATAALAQPAAAPAPAASAASAPAKLSPHARAAQQRALAADDSQQQGGFTLLAHGRAHRPQLAPRNP